MYFQTLSTAFLRFLFSLVCLILIAQTNFTAVSIDSTNSNGASDTITGITSLTWQHTVNSCSNCVLYVRDSTYTQLNLAAARDQSVTFGNQTLTAVGGQVSPFPALPATGNSSAEIFRLIAPSDGTATVTVNFLAPVNYAVGSSVSLNGVSQTTSNSTFSSSSANSDSPAASATNSVPGDLVLDVLAASPNAIYMAEGPGQSACSDTLDETTCSRGRRFFSFSFDVGSMSVKPAALSVTPVAWSMSNASSWALGAITVKQFVISSANVAVSGRVLTPDGQGIVRALVTLSDKDGLTQTAITNPFGFYRFENVRAGENYVISAVSKTWRFQDQTLTVTDDLSDVDLVAEPYEGGKF